MLQRDTHTATDPNGNRKVLPWLRRLLPLCLTDRQPSGNCRQCIEWFNIYIIFNLKRKYNKVKINTSNCRVWLEMWWLPQQQWHTPSILQLQNDSPYIHKKDVLKKNRQSVQWLFLFSGVEVNFIQSNTNRRNISKQQSLTYNWTSFCSIQTSGLRSVPVTKESKK